MLQSVRSVLEISAAYNLWWNAIGGRGYAKVVLHEYLQPRVGARILEIGCGPGTIYLPQIEYLGFDLSSKYIETARKPSPQAQFVCERVSRFSLAKKQSFDAVLALGIVHHLDDQEEKQMFQIAFDALEPGGKLITVDGVSTSDQSEIATYLLARDRGRFVRTRENYVNLASQVFSNVRDVVRHELLRIPYAHILLEWVR